MTRLISAEFFKLRKRTMTWVLLAVLVAVIILIYLLLLQTSSQVISGHPNVQETVQNLLGLPVALPVAMSILSSFGAVLAVILSASTIGNEYGWRTIRTFLISSEGRSKLLAAKLISVSLYVLAGMLIGLAAGFIMSLITTAIGGYQFSFSFATGSYLWDQFLQFWRTFYVLLPYILLGFMFAVLGRSVIPGIAAGIGIFFLESIITSFMRTAGGWVANIPDYLLIANARAINSMAKLPANLAMGFGGGSNGQAPTPTHAFITLGIYSIAFLVIAFWLFRRRDVTG